MEKYCPNCRRVFSEGDFKICHYCGARLKERVGRQSIPGHLRHKVLKRDGYRCVECGATNKETSLEIDHIIPVSKGGTNDLSNLQTLCKRCNRAKSATIWGIDSNLEIKRLRLAELSQELSDIEFKYNCSSSEDEKIDCKFRIVKINEEISSIQKELEVMEEKVAKKKEEERKKLEEFNRKDKLFKKLYVELTDVQLAFCVSEFKNFRKALSDEYRLDIIDYSFDRDVPNHFKINENSSFRGDYIFSHTHVLFDNFSFNSDFKEKLIKFITENYSQEEVDIKINEINEKIKNAKELNNQLDSFYLDKLAKKLSVKRLANNQNFCYYLVSKYPKEKINTNMGHVDYDLQFAKELDEKYDDKFINKLYQDLSTHGSSLSKKDNGYELLDNVSMSLYYAVPEIHISKKDKINYIVDNINDKNQIDSKIDEINNKIEFCDELSDMDERVLEMFFSYYNAPDNLSKDEKLYFVVDRHNKESIQNKINEFYEKVEFCDELYENLDKKVLANMCLYYNVPSKYSTRKDKIDYIVKINSINGIKNTIDVIEKKLEYYNKLDKELDDDILNELCIKWKIQKQDRKEKLTYLIEHYSIKSIERGIKQVNDDLKNKTFCPNCKKPNDSSTTFCIFCGTKIKKLICPNCNAEMRDDTYNFCTNCGAKLN